LLVVIVGLLEEGCLLGDGLLEEGCLKDY